MGLTSNLKNDSLKSNPSKKILHQERVGTIRLIGGGGGTNS